MHHACEEEDTCDAVLSFEDMHHACEEEDTCDAVVSFKDMHHVGAHVARDDKIKTPCA
jgi:hypothetical protein